MPGCAVIPSRESERLAALHALEILDTEAEPAFETIVGVAARLFDVPIALVSLVDEHRQWFKARVGLDLSESPRWSSFCTHALADDRAMVVEDAALDERFAANPLVVDTPHIRFYAGAPLRLASGHAIGTLCVLDRVPRTVDRERLGLLAGLAAQVIDQIEARRRAATLLAQARELEVYRRFFELTLDPTATVTADLRFERVNGAWTDRLGWQPEDLLGSNLLGFVHPDDVAATRQEAQRLASEGSPTVGFEHRFRHRDGSYVHLAWVASVDGDRFFATARDVTVVRAKTLVLRASSEVWATFSRRGPLSDVLAAATRSIARELDLVAATAYVFTERGQAIAFSSSDLAQPLSSTRLQNIAVSGEMLVLEVGQDSHGDLDWASQHHEVGAFVGLPLIQHDSVVGVLAVYARCPLDEGRIDALRAVATTLGVGIQRTQTVSQLERFKTTLDRTLDALLIVDAASMRVTYSNAGARAISGYTEDALRSSIATELLFPSSSDLTRAFTETKRGVQSITIETLLQRQDGAAIPVEVSVQFIAADDAGTASFICLMRDISERRRIDQLQSEFVSTVSHELRTPLTAIRGSLGLVASGITGAVPTEAREYVEIALANSARLVRLINDILDIEKMQSGRMDFRARCIELSELTDQAVRANRGIAAEHGGALVLASPVPPGEVFVDPDRFAQVLANLISNAAKFSPPSVPVELRVTSDGDWFRIAVEDRGPGIPESFRPRLFQRFAQADTSSTRARGGTGLGLSISKAIVERHGGKLDYEAREGGGTRFVLALRRLPEPTEADTPRPRVLVVGPLDACEDIRRCLGEDFVVDVSPTIERAARFLATRDYVALALDRDLPDGDARVLLGHVRDGHARGRTLPPIAVARIQREQFTTFSELVTDPLADFNSNEVVEVIRVMAARVRERVRRVLHVEDDEHIRRIIRRLLPASWLVVGAATIADAVVALRRSTFDAVVLDLILPDGAGADLVPLVPRAPIVIFSSIEPHDDVRRRVKAVMVKTRASARDVCEAVVAITEAQP